MFNNKIVIFDLDGTIFEDFIEYDKEYIKLVFKNNFLVLFIDLIARFFNSLEGNEYTNGNLNRVI